MERTIPPPSRGRLGDMIGGVIRFGCVGVTRYGVAAFDGARPVACGAPRQSWLMLWLMVATCATLLGGCGSSEPSMGDSPATDASPRVLGAGDRVSRACGLTLTVPQDMSGYIKGSGRDGPLEDVGLSSEDRQLFVNVSSYTDQYIRGAGKTWNGWMLLSRSADDSIEVRWLADEELTVSIVAVITRLPGRATGELLVQSGEEDAPWTPAAARQRAAAVWAELSVEGAELPAP